MTSDEKAALEMAQAEQTTQPNQTVGDIAGGVLETVVDVAVGCGEFAGDVVVGIGHVVGTILSGLGD